MNGMNDQHFFDLAMKLIANQATDAERAELDSAAASDPQVKAELERLRAESRVLKEVLPLVQSTEAKSGELPAYARARLQTKVRQTLGSPRRPEQEENKALHWGWRVWALGAAVVTALIAILAVPTLLKAPAPIIQVAMLDLVGTTRGTNTVEVETLRHIWKDSPVETFSSASALGQWEKSWPDQGKRPVFKVIYDRSTAEVRVVGRFGEKQFQKGFAVEEDLQAAIMRAAGFIAEQTGR